MWNADMQDLKGFAEDKIEELLLDVDHWTKDELSPLPYIPIVLWFEHCDCMGNL